MKTLEEVKQILDRPLPDEAISQHPTKIYLSSIKAIFVTERMNEAFGIGGWRVKVEPVVTGEKGMVVVKVTYEVPNYNIYYECFGGNDNGGEGSKNFDLGDAYKGATTDAITKIGSYLGIGADVFKGKKNPPKNTQNTTTNSLPWLPDAKVKGIIDWAKKEGKNFEQVMIELQAKYRVNKNNEESLKTALNG